MLIMWSAVNQYLIGVNAGVIRKLDSFSTASERIAKCYFVANETMCPVTTPLESLIASASTTRQLPEEFHSTLDEFANAVREGKPKNVLKAIPSILNDVVKTSQRLNRYNRLLAVASVALVIALCSISLRLMIQMDRSHIRSLTLRASKKHLDRPAVPLQSLFQDGSKIRLPPQTFLPDAAPRFRDADVGVVAGTNADGWLTDTLPTSEFGPRDLRRSGDGLGLGLGLGPAAGADTATAGAAGTGVGAGGSGSGASSTISASGAVGGGGAADAGERGLCPLALPVTHTRTKHPRCDNPAHNLHGTPQKPDVIYHPHPQVYSAKHLSGFAL